MTACLSVALCVDGGNIDQAAVTIASVLAHLSLGPPLTFHVFYGERPSRRSRRMGALRAAPHRVFLHHVENRFRDIALFDHVTPAALLRLDLGELLPDLDRVLYLDADILALADIRPLLATDLGGAAAGAVQDFGLHAALAEEAITGQPDFILHVRDALGWDTGNFTKIRTGSAGAIRMRSIYCCVAASRCSIHAGTAWSGSSSGSHAAILLTGRQRLCNAAIPGCSTSPAPASHGNALSIFRTIVSGGAPPSAHLPSGGRDGSAWCSQQEAQSCGGGSGGGAGTGGQIRSRQHS